MLRIFNESVVPSAEVANNSKLNKPNLKQEDCIQVTGNTGLLLPPSLWRDGQSKERVQQTTAMMHHQMPREILSTWTH